MITLIMLSGGIDSTYQLVRMLRDSEDEVLAHHVHFATNLGRHEPEDRACRDIVPYCRKNYRPFSFTQSAIDHRRFLAHGYDLLAAALEAGAVAGSYHLASGRRVDRWVLGRALEETAPGKRFRQAEALARDNCQGIEGPDLHVPEPVTQQAQIDDMPLELYRMTWSCRLPRRVEDGFAACGTCATCKRLVGTAHRLEAEAAVG